MDVNIQNKIIESSKALFYDNDYLNISMKDIADKVQIPINDLLNYYDEKNKIAGEVYSGFYHQINETIMKSYININNSLVSLFITMRIYYELILTDKKNAKFTCDILKNEPSSAVFGFLYEVYWDIVKEYGVAISKRELNLMLLCDHAAQRELILRYLKGDLEEFNIDDIFIFLQSTIPRSLKIDHRLIDHMLLKSISIAKVIDKTDLRLLI